MLDWRARQMIVLCNVLLSLKYYSQWLLFFFNMGLGAKCPSFPLSESRGKGLPLNPRQMGLVGCCSFTVSYTNVQVFRHLFILGEVLPYWPVWDLKGHRDPCVSPLIKSFIRNEDDVLHYFATQHLKWGSWEQESYFLSSSHGASGAEEQLV